MIEGSPNDEQIEPRMPSCSLHCDVVRWAPRCIYRLWTLEVGVLGIPETVLESLMRINLGPKEDKVRGSMKASGDSVKAFES